MKNFTYESLVHDAIHGYIPFTSDRGLPQGEVSEQEVIDHPWVQRMRQIRQLQTAWWVYPTAEHTRFQHVLGVMHVASRATEALYQTLAEVCPDVPSRGYVEALLRMAALLHDVGHGPFGHFFDDHFLSRFELNHEVLGCHIIRTELADLLKQVRRTPNAQLNDGEQLDPDQIAFLIRRPKDASEDSDRPQWLRFLRSLFSGVYTLDNMDFVLRDSYMTGYNIRAFDLDRLLHYTFFSEHGVTLHERGLPALVRFISVRGELFRSVYFHRTVRSIDLTLQDLFADSNDLLFPGNPLENLAAYRNFTEWSLLVDVARWPESEDPRRRELGQRWAELLRREVHWKLACERSLFFGRGDAERSSIFSHEDFVERALRETLPAELKNEPLRIDLARHVHRPGTRWPTAGANFIYSPAREKTTPLDDNEIVRRIPVSWRICRVYAQTDDHNTELAAALDRLIGPGGEDDLTNM